MKILVTGGAGYIGSMVVASLLEQGYEVTVVDNFMYKQASLNQLCHYQNFTIINGDVRQKSVMEPLLRKTDAILPLAAYVGAPLCQKDPLGASSTNKEAILMMLAMLSNQQIILMPTTNSAYGKGDENNFCDETSPLRPISHYAREKVEVEQALMQHQNAISFRFATVFGMSPRMRIDLLVNNFTYRAVNDGTLVLFEPHFKRNYLHIKDVSRLILYALENHHSMCGEIYNVGLSESNLTKEELCQSIQLHVPNFTYLIAETGKDPDQRDYLVSNQKIEQAGFKPIFSLDDGIVGLIKGYQMINDRQYGNI